MTESVNENVLLTSLKFIEQKEYWAKKLTGEITTTRMPGGKETPGSPVDVKTAAITIPAPISARIMKLSKGADISIYLLLLTALKILIYDYTGMEEISVVSPVYAPGVTADTKNRGLTILDRLESTFTFKETLISVMKSVLEA
ncbi:MAG: hypothetical protein GY757_30250 [bacterium]|nr:hypothetical protein [bacterium]